VSDNDTTQEMVEDDDDDDEVMDFEESTETEDSLATT